MFDFDKSPLLVIWEVTRACDLACVHCRACPIAERNPKELTTAEGVALLQEIKRFGSPLVVFTGGDVMKRPDLFTLIEASVTLGLRTTTSPSATPLLTNEMIDRFQASGISRMAISLDGPDAATHDAFRGIPGTFDRAIQALRHAQEIGLETQIQTTVTRFNIEKLRDIARIVGEVGGKMWSVFFLVTTGRARPEDDLTAEEYEQVFATLYDIAKTSTFDVKTTEGMHYRRYLAQHPPLPDHGWHTATVNDGKGFVFVSHTGDICPSGFLPVTAGNVRTDSLVDVYRNSSLFRILRNLQLREGKCGHCEYKKLCGGSRARAYALTGDVLAEDPRCVYQPSPS